MKRLLLLVSIMLLVCIATAAPTTLPASAIGNNNITFNGNGASGPSWFQWGFVSGSTWSRTPNVTPAAGVIKYTMKGTPVFGCTTYLYRACDATGCGSEVSLLTTAVTPLPQVVTGDIAQNMTEQGLDPGNLVWNAMRIYTDRMGETVFYGFVFALVFIGIWLRTRGTSVASTFGMICIGIFGSSMVGLGLGLPPEFLAVGQALLYLSLTGAVMAFTFK